MSRRQARETALRIMFQVDIGKIPWESALSYMSHEDGIEGRDREYLDRLVSGTVAHLNDIDTIIGRTAVDWKLERMLGTDRNILRIATYELMHCPDVPTSVTVNEAVELAKAYGDDNSGRFVNGILGRVAREEVHRPEPEG